MIDDSVRVSWEASKLETAQGIMSAIESLRKRLQEQVGQAYDEQKVQKAEGVSCELDKLICRWYEAHLKEKQASETVS